MDVLLILAALAFVLAMVFVRGFAEGLMKVPGVIVGAVIDMLGAMLAVAEWFF